jgi:hypothetical protein
MTVTPEPETNAEDGAPHVVSLAVWDTPAPAIAGAAATFKVGVQCTQGCDLRGQRVTLRDTDGAALATHTLSEEKEGLCWGEIAFTAPSTLGVAWLSAAYEAEDEAHEAKSVAFTMRTAPKPEHKVAVRVTYGPTGEPVAGAEIRMNLYQAYTDAGGAARFDLPSGQYVCTFRKRNMIANELEISVAGNDVIELVANRGETQEELEARLSAMEDREWG